VDGKKKSSAATPTKSGLSSRESPLADPGLRRRLRGRLLALGHDPAEAEDLTQETLVRACLGLPQFRGESSLATWVMRIAENVVQDRRRVAQRRPLETAEPLCDGVSENLADSATADPEEEAERRLSAECIRGTLQTLPEQYRSAVELHDLEGLENPEIARRLGLPVSTVKIRVHRARRRLRGACEEDCEPYSDGRGNVACRPRKPRPG
jgi:RNA polymerase sigma-70 factor (ECF subfamily)